jgi:hypothetical protein
VSGARGYDVRVRRSGRLVLRVTPRRPAATEALAPGAYRWTVTAVGGPNDGFVVVDAPLTVVTPP